MDQYVVDGTKNEALDLLFALPDDEMPEALRYAASLGATVAEMSAASMWYSFDIVAVLPGDGE